MREESNYFLLVAAGVDPRRLADPSAYRVALHRMTIGKSRLRDRTRNCLLSKPGDKIITYAAGKCEYGVHVVGEVEVASEATPLNKTRTHSIDSPSASSYVVSEYYLELKKGRVSAHPACLRDLKHNIAFIKSPQTSKWAACLQNGCVRISAKDFQLIDKHGNRTKS